MRPAPGSTSRNWPSSSATCSVPFSSGRMSAEGPPAPVEARRETGLVRVDGIAIRRARAPPRRRSVLVSVEVDPRARRAALHQPAAVAVIANAGAVVAERLKHEPARILARSTACSRPKCRPSQAKSSARAMMAGSVRGSIGLAAARRVRAPGSILALQVQPLHVEHDRPATLQVVGHRHQPFRLRSADVDAPGVAVDAQLARSRRGTRSRSTVARSRCTSTGPSQSIERWRPAVGAPSPRRHVIDSASHSARSNSRPFAR